jgi:hypothetical protein
MGTRVSFLEDKGDQSPPNGTKVKNGGAKPPLSIHLYGPRLPMCALETIPVSLKWVEQYRTPVRTGPHTNPDGASGKSLKLHNATAGFEQ